MKEKKFIITIVSIVFIMIAGSFYGYACLQNNQGSVISLSTEADEKMDEIENDKVMNENEKGPVETADVKKEIFVHICGQIQKPGVYKLESDARIADAIKAAGGLTKKAAADFVNQAELLVDGIQIYIPSKKEMKEKQSIKEGLQNSSYMCNENSESTGKVNLNLATKEELMSLPGIGEAKANSIITYREEHGNFQSIEDIKNISGIKEGVFNSISDYITV